MSNEVKLSEVIKARDHLRSKGYTQERCPSCSGTGFMSMGRDEMPGGYQCMRCGGKGYVWKSPVMC